MISPNTGSHADSHTKPYQSLQTDGILHTETGPDVPCDHQEDSTGKSQDSWQYNVGIREKQAALSVVHQQVDSTQTHQQPHDLVKKEINVIL